MYQVKFLREIVNWELSETSVKTAVYAHCVCKAA